MIITTCKIVSVTWWAHWHSIVIISFHVFKAINTLTPFKYNVEHFYRSHRKRKTILYLQYFYLQIFVGRGDEPLGYPGIIRIKQKVTIAELNDCLLNNPPYKWLKKSEFTFNEYTISFDESGYASLNVPVRLHTDELQLDVRFMFL